MKPQSTFSPVSLRYIAALRGKKPKPTGAEFTYAEVACTDPEALICLAASNPEGRFYGFVADEAARRAGEILAINRGIFNAVFIAATPSQILARLANGSSLPPMLDYLCCDQSAGALPADEKQALYDLAEKRLNAGGMFTTSYRPYDSEDGALRFLVRELVPEMTDDQKQELLTELKRLGTTYLSTHAEVSAKLTDAIIKGAPASFFDTYSDAPAPSGTFDVTVAMRSRGLAYAGDANLTSNYVELAVPREAQDLVVKCRDHILYEQIKDLALNRSVRSDIWVKLPVEQSAVPAELFGGFAYGITLPRDQVPTTFKAQGKDIDLSGSLYVKLIDLMSTLPMGIGDFLAHPSGQNEQPEKIIEALQILVACGIASPMRGLRAANSNTSSIAQPRLVGSFNSYLDKTDLSDKEVWFSSSVMGCGVAVPARDAFVMQALNRAGLTNSVSALMPELRRIANTPSAKTIFKSADPTAEIAQELIRDVVGKSLPQWYAYALLSAA
jgi:hypothetical protein